jgi:hypothetical protein
VFVCCDFAINCIQPAVYDELLLLREAISSTLHDADITLLKSSDSTQYHNTFAREDEQMWDWPQFIT